jgi:hypothetical protein
VPPTTSYTIAELAAKELVTAAGGEIITSFIYPGGFFYHVSPLILNPLGTGQEVGSGATVRIDAWKQFERPLFDRFLIVPYHAADRSVTAGRRMTICGVKSLLPDSLRSPKANVGKRAMSAWFGMLARDYGKSVSYIA